MSQQYRYPGVKPFQTSDSHIFYGRKEDVNDLYQLFITEPVVVLHAKSGMGKSSLINAGLIPQIEKEKAFTTYKIRFFAHRPESTFSPLEATLNTLKSPSSFLDKIKPDGEHSLWYHLKSIQLGAAQGQSILLIFDQFEELFTYPAKTVQQFAHDLSEALYTTLPQRFREERKKGFTKDANYLSTDELALLNQPINLRLLFSIRSDRMSLLKDIKAYLPNLLSADYQLKGLTRLQTEDAILSPAYQKNGFITPTFDFEEDAITYLLDFLSDDGQESIEAFQLQILCEYIEQRVVEKENKRLISKTDLQNPDQILENYYLNKINSIPVAEDRIAARKLIEDGLILEEEHRRLTIYEGQIQKNYGIDSELLGRLLNTHIIRSEPSGRGGYTYELSHDTLVAPVLKAKAKRLEQENKIKEEQEKKILEAKAEAERRRAEEQKQLRQKAEVNEKKAVKRTRLAWLISIVGIGLAIFAGSQFFKAQNVLSKLEVVNAQTVERLLPEIDQHIMDLDYHLVLEKSIAALAYNGDREKITRNLQETAYFYTESGQLEKAAEVLHPLDIKPSPLDAKTLTTHLQNLDATYYELLTKRYYPTMISVKGGTFTMGCQKGDCAEDELPLHQVQLADFEMAETETTWWQFALYCAAEEKDIQDFTPSKGNTPAVNVEWYDAIEYCNWLSRHKAAETVYTIDTNQLDLNNLDAKRDPKRWLVSWKEGANGYRLPTEAEWEYAAYGGINQDTFLYSGSDIIDSVGWIKETSGNKIQPVGTKNPNSLGIYDMTGNSWEWCWDWKDEEDTNGDGRYQDTNDYYKKFENTTAVNPRGPEQGIRRIIRGLSIAEVKNLVRIANRTKFNPHLSAHIIGFRCVK